MSIEIRNGDIFEQTDLELIIHQANCFNKMGAGIAKEIARRFPEAVEADNRTRRGDKNKLGSYTCAVNKDKQHIINLYGQYNYGFGGPHTDYGAVEKALAKVIYDYEGSIVFTERKTVVGVPYLMGCDRGGGDWTVMEGILRKLFENNSDFHLVVCKLEK